MTKVKYIIIILFVNILFLLIPNISNADDVSVTRNIYSNNGSMKFTFSGLTLNTKHEYEFGFIEKEASEVKNWFTIKEITENTAVVDIAMATKELRDVFNVSDTGYITIRDKTDENKVVLDPYAVDLKIPFLQVTNYTLINNGKEFNSGTDNSVDVPLRNVNNCKPYYQYEKIKDEKIINKYKEIKSTTGDYLEMQNMLTTTVPKANWSNWSFFNGFDSDGMGGYGYPQKIITAPDNGLYYLWFYFAGNNVKDLYGYALVDNLQPEIALEKISLPQTEKVELGETITLNPTFTPANATNKMVTWTSSDETVATVDNGGKVTSKKIGSTVITVTSEDGKKVATCTVTVVEKIGDTQNPNGGGNGNNGGSGSGSGNNGGSGSGSGNNGGSGSGSGNNGGSGSGSGNNGGSGSGSGNNGGSGSGSGNNGGSGGTSNNGGNSDSNKKDDTTSPVVLPKTGAVTQWIIIFTLSIGTGVFFYCKYRKLKDVR